MESPSKLFVMAGMPRAGTTYIYQALQAHPSVYLTYRKELSFFSLHRNRGEDWYRKLFAEASDDQICGDISPDYFLHDDVAERIREFTPRAKVIIAVRDPASWAVSFHRHIATFEWQVPSFANFLERHRVPDNRLVRFRNPSRQSTFAIADSLVSRNVEAFRKALGPDLLLYSFDLFRSSPSAVLKAIERFLNLPPMLGPSNLPAEAINASQRRNSRILSFLLSREELIALADRAVPRELLRRARGRVDRLAAVPAGALRADPNYAEDLALARERLEPDCEWVRALFRHHPIQLGNGSAFSAE